MSEEIQKLRLENQSLCADVERLNLELRKLSREMRISKSFMDKVTRAADAKDTLSSALSAANARQRAYTDMLLESCPSIIMLFDSNGNFVLSTDALLTATDTPNFDYIRDRNYKEVLSRYFTSDSMEAFHIALKKAAASSEIVVFDVWADFSLSGQHRFFSVELRQARTGKDSAGNIMRGILAVMVDLTDIMNEKQRAETANNEKSDFLAAISHEIRTPMNAIIGMSEVLNRTELNEQQKKYVSNIMQSSSALLLIINDIFDFSKIEAGKMELVYGNYNLKALLDKLYAMFSILCQEKELEFNYFVSDNLPEVVHGDENRLRQVLTNLLSNAVKYTKRGGVTLSAWMDEHDILRFDVKDSGKGIRKMDMVKLFRPFEQFDTKKNRDAAGNGLGLAISYNLCKLMGGDLRLDSIYGEGSNFSVILPYIQPDRRMNDDDGEICNFTAPEAKILVVDDIDINLEVAQAMLGAFEIVPTLALSGQEAIEYVKETRFDIIFMDHLMPEMDGLEATMRIRKLGGWNNKVPIIALTANAINGMDMVFLNSRMNDYLFKPVNIAKLNLCLRKWLPDSMIKMEDHQND